MTIFNKLFGVGILAAALIWAWDYYWTRPEIWNATAEGYQLRARTLAIDVANRDIVIEQQKATIADRDSVIVKKNKLIAWFEDEARKAVSLGEHWKSLFAEQVAAWDVATEKLSDKEAELAYLKAMELNGTLRGNLTNLSITTPKVIRAGLKTAGREAAGGRMLDSMALSYGRVKASNLRLGQGLASVGRGLSKLSSSAREKADKGGVWPVNVRRKREERALAKQADSLIRQVNEISDLEDRLNKP